MTSTPIDEREMYCCLKCKHQWYSRRTTTNGYYSIVDNIAAGVSDTGSYEIHSSILINYTWPGGNFDALAREWCRSHNISMSFTERREENGDTQYAMFVRSQ
jgi:hypothetical protein